MIRGSFVRGGLGLLAAAVLTAGCGPDAQTPLFAAAATGTPTKDQPAWAGPKRPALEQKSGRAFAYSVPQGWQVRETSNGVDISAADGVTGVAASVLVGGFGQPTPEAHLRQVLASTGQENARFVSSTPIPPQPGPMGLVWRGVEVEIESTQQGRPIHIRATSQILQGAGQYAAIVTGAQGPTEDWAELRNWLPRVRDAIRITDPSVPTGNMANALPSGIRHDDLYGRFNDAWTTRQVSRDDISRAQREGMMGYRRMQDPGTGRVWELPLEAYDAGAGGYRNPNKPSELLVETRD